MKKYLFGIVSMFLVAGIACGAALTAERNTPSRKGEKMQLTVADTITIYAGAMVAVDSNGEAQNAADTANYQVVGRCDGTVDNTDDGKTVDVERGIFGWANAGDVTDANIGDICYVIDNQTVSVATNGSNSIIAGTVVDVDGSYVWVDTFNIGRTAGSFTTLAASGAATLSSTLTVTGKATLNGETECNEDVDVNLNASDEEIAITQTAVAGPGDAGLIQIDDDRTGATATESDEATITIDAEGVYAIGILDGAVAVESVIDTYAAGSLLLGSSVATKVEIADADVETEIEGTLSCEQDVELAYANKTANYTVTANDCVISYNTSAVTTNTLPEASTVLGKVFFVSLQDDDGDLVVLTDGTDTFDGTNNKITYADAGDSLSVMATAANVYTILVNVGGTLGTQ